MLSTFRYSSLSCFVLQLPFLYFYILKLNSLARWQLGLALQMPACGNKRYLKDGGKLIPDENAAVGFRVLVLALWNKNFYKTWPNLLFLCFVDLETFKPLLILKSNISVVSFKIPSRIFFRLFFKQPHKLDWEPFICQTAFPLKPSVHFKSWPITLPLQHSAWITWALTQLESGEKSLHIPNSFSGRSKNRQMFVHSQ